MARVITVSALNRYVKSVLDSDLNLADAAVEGEISNYKRYPSGHAYFSLKDRSSQIRAVMFSNYFRNMTFTPENGMKVIVRGKVTLYDKDGTYQINVTSMYPSGEGAYRIEFERIKNKLAREGLFRQERKKKLPRFPFRIGIATARQGAALHDVISVLQRRFPCVEVILAPCMVQGDAAEPTIIQAIDRLEAVKGIDLIIITRGGGSREDLWVFNSERIARRAARCTKPIISAIGHEVDVSILDFVSDVRAATPTAAAEIAVPDINRINMELASLSDRCSRALGSMLEMKRRELSRLRNSRGFSNLQHATTGYGTQVIHSMDLISMSVRSLFDQNRQKLGSISRSIESNNPLSLLRRGYSVINREDLSDKPNGFTIGDSFELTTFDQVLECEVTNASERGKIDG